MKHLFLLLYFISYTSGIGAMTLGGFHYIKTKNLYVKYIIISDMCFTAFLFFDNLNFYTDIFLHGFPFWLDIFKILGLTLSGIGVIYFFTLSGYSVIGIKIESNKKLIYFGSSSIFFTVCIVTLYVLYYLKLISDHVAIRSCFFLPDIFTSIGAFYNIFLIIKNWDKIANEFKQFLKWLLLLAAIIMPLSVFTNLVQYWHFSNIPIAYSPIEYFLFNFLALIFIKRNLQAASIKKAPQSSPKESKILYNQYKLTQREIEIVELIADGLSNQDIAEKLFISANTVRNHIYNIYRKMGIKNRYELINLVSNKTDKL